MAGNWGQIGNQLTQGFNIGAQTGGKLGGIGVAIKKVAERLKGKRETGEAIDLLGQTERVKQGIKAEFTPEPEWKPKTQEEALAFEQSKVDITGQPQAIVDDQGNVIGHRPKGSVFIPKEDPFQKYFFGKDTKPTIPTKKSFLKSPYPEYPDAFQEEGIWKVKKGNKTYRIEE